MKAVMSNQVIQDVDRGYEVERAFKELGSKVHRLEEIVELFEGYIKDLKSRLDLLTEAIAVSHMKNDDGKCIKDCLACHILDVMRGLKAARKLMGEAK
jgi:hypothetical protein